jgi:hypothetical protein
MANHDHQPLATSNSCVWCAAEYSPEESRARTPALFCSHKCEIEARYWLVSELQALA